MTPSPSYKQLAECCGREDLDCELLSDPTATKPCWGQVAMFIIDSDDGDIPVHMCEGHRDIPEFGDYHPELKST